MPITHWDGRLDRWEGRHQAAQENDVSTGQGSDFPERREETCSYNRPLKEVLQRRDFRDE